MTVIHIFLYVITGIQIACLLGHTLMFNVKRLIHSSLELLEVGLVISAWTST